MGRGDREEGVKGEALRRKAEQGPRDRESNRVFTPEVTTVSNSAQKTWWFKAGFTIH